MTVDFFGGIPNPYRYDLTTYDMIWCDANILNVKESLRAKGGSPLLYGMANLGLLLFGAAPTAAINGIDTWQEIACPADMLNLNEIVDMCLLFFVLCLS